LWQAANHFPTLEFMRNATHHKMVTVTPLAFLQGQLLTMGPGTAPVWIAGLLFALFARAGRPWRMFAWGWLAVCALLLAGGHSRASYLAPAYPVLLAAGGVAWERMLSAPRLQWAQPMLAALVAALGLIALP